jgi:predicted phage-related endonuclease
MKNIGQTKDYLIVRSLARLVNTCASFVTDQLHAAQCSSSRIEKQADSLKSAARLIEFLPLLAEHRAIRCGRSENIAPITQKALLITEVCEHANGTQAMEMPLSDLIVFPSKATPSVAGSTESASAFGWPQVADLTLSAERLDARSRGIGGSDANIILSGDSERILRLWREKRGESPPEDLSDKLSVVLGSWTEDFNRQWYEKISGNRVLESGSEHACSEYRWRKCTLDGLIAGSNAVFEAKHTNAFVKADEVLERYMPQLQHNMAVTQSNRAILSVIFGNAKYEMFEVAADWLYQLDLLRAEKAFWSSVLSGELPVVADPPPAPRCVATRELSFDGNNLWASAAADWLETSKAAKTHASACKSLKELLEDDVSRAFGHGIEAKRNKAGAISIRELK